MRSYIKKINKIIIVNKKYDNTVPQEKNLSS